MSVYFSHGNIYLRRVAHHLFCSYILLILLPLSFLTVFLLLLLSAGVVFIRKDKGWASCGVSLVWQSV